MTAPTVTVDLLIEEPRWQEVKIAELAETAAKATLAHLGLEPGAFEVSVLACDDARIAALNGEFRDKPRPTNVLSWPAADLAPDEPGGQPAQPEPLFDGELGDIAIAYETCVTEAQEQKKPLGDHLLHLLVHGTLHLLGYDHETDADAAVMEGLEREILVSLGVPDPYSTQAA
jgi:probable rRNA maturation factor